MGSSPIFTTLLRQLAAAAGILALAVLCGFSAAHGYVKPVLAIAAVAVIAACGITRRGAFIAIMLVAAMNGVPLIDLSRKVVSHITGEDLAIVALVAAALIWPIVDGATSESRRAARALMLCGVGLLGWWMFTVARTSWAGHASLLAAADYGRDFGFFAVLLIVLPRVRLTERDLKALIGVFLVAVCIYAVGHIATVVGLNFPKSLVHIQKANKNATFDLTRVYASMNDAIIAGLAPAVGALLLAPTRRGRLIAAPIALLLAVSFTVQLSRARWIGLVVGLVLVSVLLVSRDSSASVMLKSRLGVLVGAVGAAILTAILSSPTAVLSGPIGQRISSIFTSVNSSGSTVAVRENVISMMATMLSGKWAIGLGLIPPSAHIFGALPQGSLRNTDVGVMNAVITMGIIGAALVYLPLLIVAARVLGRRIVPVRFAWLRYGLAIWVLATLISSASIVTLFSLGGLAVTSVILTILVHPSVSGPEAVAVRRAQVRLPRRATAAT